MKTTLNYVWFDIRNPIRKSIEDAIVRKAIINRVRHTIDDMVYNKVSDVIDTVMGNGGQIK